ncbi:DNA binding protein [Serendipita sp. 411]|nr:DNA binding protein [Serendipita sp. 411]
MGAPLVPRVNISSKIDKGSTHSSRYHGSNDPRIPTVFKCFECRLRSTHASIVIGESSLKEYILKYSELALFRRALKIVETENPHNVTEFRRLVGATPPVAAQLWKRLESEGFVGPEYVQQDGLGMFEQRTMARAKNTTAKARIPKTSKTRYTKNPSISTMIDAYFDPSEGMERQHIGLGVKSRRERVDIVPLEHETIYPEFGQVASKPLSPSRLLNGVRTIRSNDRASTYIGERFQGKSPQGKFRTPGKRKLSEMGKETDEGTSSVLRRSKRIKISVPQRDVDLDW